jgi:CRAL/TRIO domain
MSDNNFLNEIDRLKNEFYAKQQKNMFFKSKQKNECASMISNTLNLEQLMQNTFILIPNTNNVYINYELFKTFVNPDIYQHVISYIRNLFTYCINTYGTYNVHFNMNSFTVSAAQRYKDLIMMYNSECIKYNSRLAEKINSFIIYNTPNVIENIATLLSPLIETNVRERIILYNKTDSVKTFNEFLINNNLKN